MQSSLDILTLFTGLVITGIIISLIAKKLKFSNILILLLAGLFLGQVDAFQIDPLIILTIATFALIIIVFDGTSKFSLKALSEQSTSALKLIGLFILLNVIITSVVVTYLFFPFEYTNLLFGIIFSLIAVSTDPASTFVMLKNKTNKVVEFLEAEAILNTPIVVLLPFIVLDFFTGSPSVDKFITGFLSQILVGIGSGILVGLIFFKGTKKFYSEQISPLILIGAALLSYVLAENLNGNGVLAVAVLGFVFGYFYLSHKDQLMEFSSMMSGILEILVFMLIGFIVQINLNLDLILKSITVFLVLIAVRYLATYFLDFNKKERFYISLNMPKGITVAVLVFSLSFLQIPQLFVINELLILITIYSLILSAILNKFSQKFIRLKIED
ncbi:MAG: cation:proton antiporter [Candidatus Woesearchaeota archaeon]